MINSNHPDDLAQEFDAQSQYRELFDGHQKKIDCPYELVFNITGHMMKQDEDGRDMKCDQVCNKNYHIPVKEGADPKVFMDTFFNFLEGCLAQSAKHAYTNDSSITPATNNE